ncbi:hypothetical protein A1E_03380 [Rickettsia canadensis str. McKiel]|uniref:Uncharacterized protein n=1 Tax=Rickettsia canadensis (strain McKiel) TaxID=293613 RepID=A8EZ28_RICCK|nr:hypothetical protein A1E_03380 [Rickettsia canadensis str. McKiel]
MEFYNDLLPTECKYPKRIRLVLVHMFCEKQVSFKVVQEIAQKANVIIFGFK